MANAKLCVSSPCSETGSGWTPTTATGRRLAHARAVVTGQCLPVASALTFVAAAIHRHAAPVHSATYPGPASTHVSTSTPGCTTTYQGGAPKSPLIIAAASCAGVTGRSMQDFAGCAVLWWMIGHCRVLVVLDAKINNLTRFWIFFFAMPPVEAMLSTVSCYHHTYTAPCTAVLATRAYQQ
jgi:hypothetical protein